MLSAFLLLGQALAATALQYSAKQYGLGQSPVIDGLGPYTGQPVELNTTQRVLTLDYGTEVGGWPWIEVSSLDEGPVQVELKYSEQYEGLWSMMGDGPWLYTIGLMNSFRTETFNVTNLGHFQSYFLQGGLRWMTVTLITGTSLAISSAGIEASVTVQDPGTLPGTFTASNDTFSQVWDLGARAVQVACVDKGSQLSTWDISSDGAFIRGQHPAVSANGSDWDMYTLEFSTKISTGGTGWRFAGAINGGYGPYLVLTSNKPGLDSISMSQLPLNSLTVGYGFSIIQQQILPSAATQTINISMPVENDVWYRIKTTINADNWTISINNTQVAVIDSSQFQGSANQVWGTGSLTSGTIGFGPWYQQAAWFKDVQVTAQDGTVVYSNSFISEETLDEYAVHANPYSVCLDGPKRDRAAWIGDFAHTARSIAVSSGRFDYIKSMIELEFDWQLHCGPGSNLVPIQAMIGAPSGYAGVWYPSEYALGDYQFFFMLVLGEYFAASNDTELVSTYWDQTKDFVGTLIDRFLDTSTHFISNSSTTWFTAPGEQEATAPTALFVAGLNSLIKFASVLGDTGTKENWAALSKQMTDAINLSVWNGQYYGVSRSNLGASSVLATAFTIQGQIATDQSSSGNINALANSLVNIGYKDTSSDASSSQTQLSPNTQGFLLEALFQAYLRLNISIDVVMPAITTLTKTFWPVMVNQNEYYTGASWEYAYADGSPGIGLFTSLGHPWGSAPTYIYTNYILGVRTQWNDNMNTYEWIFDPMYDVATGLGLTWANGTVPLASGGYIKASWAVDSGSASGYTSSVSVIRNSAIQVADMSKK